MIRLFDTTILIALCLFSYFSTTAYISDQRTQKQQPFFYQSYFEPAVLLACGHEFGRLSHGQPASLSNFLNLELPSFDCNDLPAKPQISYPSFFGQWFYLMHAAAITWKIFGINWEAIDKLAGAFVTISIATLYGIFRQFLPIPVASLGVVIIILTHKFVDLSPYFRDLSKAPFILLSILSIISIAKHAERHLKILMFASIIGLVAGIGVGFRPDVMIVLPLAGFVIFAFPKGWAIKDIACKTLSCALMGVIFWLVSAPIQNDLERSGSCRYHWALLGFGKPFSDPLAVEHGSFGLIYQFNDQLVDSVVKSHGKRVLKQPSTSYCGPHYDLASGDLFQKLIKTLPAEFLTRTLASIRQIATSTPIPYLMIIFMYVYFLRNPLHAFFTGLCLFYLLGYPATQFHYRHYFHISFIPLLISLIILTEAITLGGSILVKNRGLKGILNDLKYRFHNFSRQPKFRYRTILFVIIVFFPASIMLFGLRYYQATKLNELVQIYEKYDWSTLDLTSGSLNANLPFGGALLRIAVDNSKCQTTRSEIEFLYDDKNPAFIFNRRLSSLSGEGFPLDGTYYIQIFNSEQVTMSHMLVSEGFHDCVLNVSTTNSAGKSDLWLDLHTINGRVARPYSTIK